MPLSKATMRAVHTVPQKDNNGRQPSTFLVIGETGVGKTYRSLLELYRYAKDNPVKGKKARKILAFDANGDDFPMFPTIPLNMVHCIPPGKAARVMPVNEDGTVMDFAEKQAVVKQLVDHFADGLLVLEDPDKYMVGASGQSVVSLLTTNRHSNLDILVSHQSVAKVTTTEWQNCTWFRLHHQVDDMARYKNRIPNYFLPRIASYIVNEQYDLAHKAFEDGELTRKEYRYYKSFFVYLDMRKLKLRGCSRAAYIRACKKYIDTEMQKEMNTLLMEQDWDGNPVYKNRRQAEVKLFTDLMRHHDTSRISPLTDVKMAAWKHGCQILPSYKRQKNG